MSVLKQLKNDPAHLVWEQLDDVRAGMLGVSGSGQHMQPMTHFIDRAAGKIWFITSDETDLAEALSPSGTAHYCLVSKSQDFYACLKGTLSKTDDEAKLDELWASVAAAWFDEGKRDPHVCLLEFDLEEAALWASTGNPLVFGLEIARANMTAEHKPDLGEHTVITFAKAA